MANNYKAKQAAASTKPASVRKDQTVVVIAGSDKGKRGRVVEVQGNTDRVIVEGVNVRRCIERSADGSSKQFQDRERPVHISNVMAEEKYDARRAK